MIDIEDVKTLTLKPGQVLVLQTNLTVEKKVLETLYAHLEKLFPDNKVMILDDRFQLLVIDHESENS